MDPVQFDEVTDHYFVVLEVLNPNLMYSYLLPQYEVFDYHIHILGQVHPEIFAVTVIDL